MSQPDGISTSSPLTPPVEEILQRIVEEQRREANELLVGLEAEFVFVEIDTHGTPPTDTYEYLCLKAQCLLREYTIILRLLAMARRHAARLGDARFIGSQARVLALQRMTRLANTETHLRLAAASSGVSVEDLQAEFL